MSWTAIYDSETLTCEMDTFHQGRGVSERLKWSPSGKQLIVKFEYRFDIWELDTKELQSVERHHTVQDVAWFGEDTFLVAERNVVFKMNSTQLVEVYFFEHNYIRSIAILGENNYLALITHVAMSSEQFEPASARMEKQIIIYDMDKREEVYQVPVLEDIWSIYPIPGTLDILITHKDQKAFQLWSLDAAIKGGKITARLKKRVITPRLDPQNYIGPVFLAGNHNQFIWNVTTSGDIEIWRRETGMPYLRFQLRILRNKGVHCLSWRRSSDGTATFATAGIDSKALLIWRGEEQPVSDAPASLESPIRPSHKSTMNEESRNRWKRAVHMAAVPSSGPLPPPDTEAIEETIT